MSYDSSVEAPRPILHIDLDAFFASVEILDNPSLRGKPVVVGGDSDRGVVASASYEARRFGVKSATPTVLAKRLCPDLIIIPGHFDRYEEVSTEFHAIVLDETPVVESLGLDEVFCDLSSLWRVSPDPVAVARRIRQRVRDEMQLECGVGVARNKLFAKLASRDAKPKIDHGRLVPAAGVVLVDDEMERHWLDTLPVRALWGVGPATESKLAAIGITQIHHVARMDEKILASHLGAAQAQMLCSFARGVDTRPVENDRATKSIGHEETFAVSVAARDELARHLQRHAAVVARALRGSQVAAGTITIKVRFDDGKSINRSRTVGVALDDEVAISALALDLLQSVPDGPAVRLAGVTASHLRAATGEGQMSFDFAAEGVMAVAEEEQRRRGALRSALDDIRGRFGRSAVGTGIEMTGGELDVSRQRGSHAFGPTGETN